MSDHTHNWKGTIRGFSTNGRDTWQVHVEMPSGPGIYDGTGPSVEFTRRQAVHVLTDEGIASVERAAAEKALTEMANELSLLDDGGKRGLAGHSKSSASAITHRHAVAVVRARAEAYRREGNE